MPLDADHVGICRYRNNNDQNFLAVLDCIKELMKLTVQERIPCKYNKDIMGCVYSNQCIRSWDTSGS